MAGWTAMAGTHDFNVPDEERARSLVEALADISTWLDQLGSLDIAVVAESVTTAVIGGHVLARATMDCTLSPG